MLRKKLDKFMKSIFSYPQCIHGVQQLGTVAKSRAIVPSKQGRIYWHIDEKYLTKDLDKYKVILAFEKAFQAWQPYFAPIKLESTGNISEAPIVIRFMNNSHKNLPTRFEKETLAYAYFPNKESLGIESDMYFNDSYQWAEMHKAKQINLYKVAVHEIGHALGLEHSHDISDIMYPTYQPDDTVVITDDTYDAINFLYKKAKDAHKPKDEPQVPSGVLSIGEFLSQLFPNTGSLRRLTNRQLVLIGRLFGVQTSLRRPRSENVNIIYEYIENVYK